MVLDYIPCKRKHIKDVMEIALNITETPYNEWEDILLELIDNSVCKYKYLKGKHKNKYCMKKLKNKNNLFIYHDKEIPLCHTHKFQLLSPKYNTKNTSFDKEIQINKTRYKTTIEDISNEKEIIYEKNNYKDLFLFDTFYDLYEQLIIIDKYDKNGYMEKCEKNIKKEIKLICYDNYENPNHDKSNINMVSDSNYNIYLEQEINILNNIEYNNDHHNIDFINIRFNTNSYITKDDSFIEDNILEIVESLEIKNTNSIIRKKNLENDFDNYLYNNRKRKKRKIDYFQNRKTNFLDTYFSFTFSYTVKDHYINDINKNNKKLLNKILKYIIDIRNCIHNNHCINNKTYKNILHISDKILDII